MAAIRAAGRNLSRSPSCSGFAERNSLAICLGAFERRVSYSQPFGRDRRTTLCQALATCWGRGRAL